MNDPQPLPDEANEFAALKSLHALAAFLYERKGGEQAVREAFALAGGAKRESLEDAAAILQDKGLDHVAEIMFDIAKDCPSGIEFNPYDPGSISGQYWRQCWIRRRRQITGELERDLRRQEAKKRRQARKKSDFQRISRIVQ